MYEDILDDIEAQLLALESKDITPRVMIVDEENLGELCAYTDINNNYIEIFNTKMLLVFIPDFEFSVRIYGE